MHSGVGRLARTTDTAMSSSVTIAIRRIILKESTTQAKSTRFQVENIDGSTESSKSRYQWCAVISILNAFYGPCASGRNFVVRRGD